MRSQYWAPGLMAKCLPSVALRVFFVGLILQLKKHIISLSKNQYRFSIDCPAVLRNCRNSLTAHRSHVIYFIDVSFFLKLCSSSYMFINTVLRIMFVWGVIGLLQIITRYPDSKARGANMGPIWGRQHPGWPHVGTMNFAIWVGLKISVSCHICLLSLQFQLAQFVFG